MALASDIGRRGNPSGEGTGVAFDIGTTTIAGSSVDLSSGVVTGSFTLPNPQARWGRDLVSRLNAAVCGPGVLAEMQASVVEACNAVIGELGCVGRALSFTAAGNSVMEHLLLGVSPEPLAKVPYRPAFREARRVEADSVGLRGAPGAELFVFPLIGGFVGGDAVAVILSLGLDTAGVTALAVDIGTNSEIILSSGGRIYATSAAAGPAFEGGEIRHGMTAVVGAIRGVRIEGDRVGLDVVGGVAPRGICGSGLIDAAAVLIKAGVIDGTGRIRGRDEAESNLSGRIREEEGGNSFVLYRGASGEVVLTQDDVRALQTAKSAIRAGIKVLLDKAGVTEEGVKEVYLAGAFGSSLSKESLVRIGVLDEAWLPATGFVGDAALDGAVKALYSGEAESRAVEIARATKYVPLSGSARFEREFIRNMCF